MYVFVKSYGCSANLADGEVLAGCIAEAGYELVDSESEADVIVYNTCAVKGPTENRVIAALKRVPKDKKLIIAGCLPLINFERLQREVRFDGAVGPAKGEKIMRIINHVLTGEKVVDLEDALTAKPALSLPQLRDNPLVSVIPSSYGCLGSCTYCCVVFARGRLRSYAVQEVVLRVQKDLAAGTKEFWITSQDMACYGRDIGTNLVALLESLDAIEGDFRIRVGMMTPNLVQDMLPELVAAFKSSKVFKFLHLPVQSGDDKVLQNMNRFYTVKDFKHVVSAFREIFPKITVATDVICGFPTETRESFENTLQLIRDVKPDIVNISKFFARPRTVAAEIHHGIVEPDEIKRRSREAAKLIEKISFERNARWVGWIGEVFVDEKGKVPGSWISRNIAYKPVTLKSSANLLGKSMQVEVVKAFSTHLLGVLV